MDTRTFFEKFETFADAPNAIEKMRELVLRLAVQGRLVKQDDREASAFTLLIDTEQQKESLAKSGKYRGLTAVSPIEGSGHFDSPNGWAWVRLGDLLINRDGERVPVSKEERAGRAKRFDYYGASGVIDQIDDYLFDKPLLLIGEDGANLINRSTPIAFIARGKYWVNNHAHVLDGISEDLLRYVGLYINSIDLKPFVTGSAQPKMNQAKMNSIPIAVPPPAEQKRIVAKVDELMTLCDRLEAEQKEREAKHAHLARAALARFAEAPTPANLDYLFHPAYAIDPADLRKSILTMAVQGRLLAQVTTDEPIAPAIKNGVKLPDGHVRRRKIIKRTSIASDNLAPLPASWVYATVQELYDTNLLIDYADGNHGSLYPRTTEFGEVGVNFVSAKDIIGGRVRWAKCSRLDEDRAKRLVKGWARSGDVLLTHNATVGRVARVEEGVAPFLLGTSVTYYRVNLACIDAGFFFHVVSSPLWERQLAAVMEQTTRNQVSIQKQAFFVVPLPPRAEQRRIVAKVDALMALVDQLDAQLAESRAVAGRLMDAVVAELTRPAGGGVADAAAASDVHAALPIADSATVDEPEDATEEPTPDLRVEPKAIVTDLFGTPDRSEDYLRTAVAVVVIVIEDLGPGHGKTFVEKCLHLVEAHCDRPMGRHPGRLKRGPADLKQHNAIMDWAAEHDVFLCVEAGEGTRAVYERGDDFASTRRNARHVLGEQYDAVVSLIDTLRTLSSTEAEWAATVYASWNDFIKDGVARPTDAQIIRDIYTNWHISKQDVSEAQWRRMIKWLRDHQLVPTGKGPRVRSTAA